MAMAAKLKGEDRKAVAVIGDSGNQGSIALHTALGFHHVGVLAGAGMKFGRWLDVVLMQRDGQSHVVLFSGFENGQPRFIGSNNVNPDGSQRISWGGASGNYEIITPPR